MAILGLQVDVNPLPATNFALPLCCACHLPCLVTASASFHPHRGQGVSRSCLLVWCLFPTLFRSVKLFELSVLFLPLLVAQNVVTLLAVVRGSLWCHHRRLRCTALADPAPARRCSRAAVSWTGVCERREDVGLIVVMWAWGANSGSIRCWIAQDAEVLCAKAPVRARALGRGLDLPGAGPACDSL